MASTHERFWSKVDKRGGPDDCWWWTGATTEGYGRFGDGAVTWRAHRWSYINAFGPIPDGLVIDHLCRNRACVNPAHMEVVTDRENILRGEGRGAKQARQTHCKRGHPLEGDNLYHRPDGSRQCRACLKLAEQRRTERNAKRQNWKERAEAAEAALANTRQALEAISRECGRASDVRANRTKIIGNVDLIAARALAAGNNTTEPQEWDDLYVCG